MYESYIFSPHTYTFNIPAEQKEDFMQQFILTPTGRQEQRFLKLKVWMLEHGITFESIGKFLGISGRSVSKSLRNERMPVRHHRVLRYRLDILREHGLGLKEIQATIATIDPLPGAREFLDALREETQVIILSDTFEQFAKPLLAKLNWPTIFCNTLEVADSGEITGFRMRCPQSKLTTVRGLQSIGYDTIAAGDSFNDLGMIQASKAGFLFKSTDAIKADHPEVPAYEEFGDLLQAIRAALD